MMRAQKGWTIWGLITVVALIAFFGLMFMKLFPPYLDNLKIREALVTVSEEPGVSALSKRDLVRKLNQILYIDFADTLVDMNKTLQIEKTKKDFIMRVDYEVVVHMAYNVSALLDFKNSVSVPLGK